MNAADRTMFDAVARARPIADPLLPRLTHAADHGLLWWGVAGLLGVTRGRRRRAAGRGLLALGLASAVTNGPAKAIFRRGRPATHAVPLVRRPRRDHSTFSFPSGHSASAAAFATAVALDAPGAAVPVGALASLVAFSRVYVGVHYPSDVVAGAALGAACAFATTKVLPRRSWAPARGPPAPAEVSSLPEGDGLVVVVNESSGAGARFGQPSGVAAPIRSLLPLAKVIEVGPGDDLEAALDDAAASARVLGVAGGDGTVNAAAERALAHGLPLAIFPTGTLNHFAADLGLGAGIVGIADTVRALREGSAVAVDVGRFDGTRPEGTSFDGVFLNTASVGGYAHLVAVRERLEKRLGKWPAMVVALSWVLRNEPPIDVTIIADEPLVGTRPPTPVGPTRPRLARPAGARRAASGERRRLWLAFVGNGIYHPPGFAPTYRERLDERMLDLRLVDGTVPLARTRLVAAVLTGRLRRTPVYEQRAATRIEITAVAAARGRARGRVPSMPFARDGEVTGRARRLMITPNGARLVVFRPR
ncbi:phosphatase PAP2 family protein [Frankia nepalensis]